MLLLGPFAKAPWQFRFRETLEHFTDSLLQIIRVLRSSCGVGLLSECRGERHVVATIVADSAEMS